jgi:hypothetical protein
VNRLCIVIIAVNKNLLYFGLMPTKVDPNNLLAEKIIMALKAKGLVVESTTNLKQLLIEGKAKDVDWRLVLEKAINQSQSKYNETIEAGN